MDLLTAQTGALQLLDAVINAAEDDFQEAQRSPCEVLRRFRSTISESRVPILFRNLLSEIQHRLSGICRAEGFSDATLESLRNCISYCEEVATALNVDLADQIGIAKQLGITAPPSAQQPQLELPGDGVFECKLLDATTSEAVKAVIENLTVTGNLDDKKFASVQRIISWRGFSCAADWELCCRDLMDNLPVDADTDIVGWIGCEVVSAKWSQVVSNTHRLFDDNYVMPNDAAWLLFFFHEDSLEYGVR